MSNALRDAPSAAREVWACAKCGEAAVIVVVEWEHTVAVLGIDAGKTGQKTRELRCQACGAKYVLRPASSQIRWLIVGGIFAIPFILPGLPFLYYAWRLSTLGKRIPIVPGAPAPRLRFPGGAPDRVCGQCSRRCAAVNTTRRSHNGVPLGTEYEYRCDGCRRSFVVESAWAFVVRTLMVLVVTGIAALFLTQADSPGWRFGGAGVSALIAIAIELHGLVRLSHRARNRVLDSTATPSARSKHPLRVPER